MPLYCYRHGDLVVQKYFHICRPPKTLTVAGTRFHRSMADEGRGPIAADANPWSKPVRGTSVGVAANQVEKQRELHSDLIASHDMEFLDDGDPMFYTPRGKREYLKRIGYHDLDGVSGGRG